MHTPTESALRRLAKRRGFSVRTSRQRKNVPNIDNFGDYMLVDASTNGVVLGERFDATLEDIDQYLSFKWTELRNVGD
jgi:hypothetical protein